MPTVDVPMADIKDWDTFARTLGFPDFYGRNMNAWVDCLTYEDDGMSAVPIPAGDVLTVSSPVGLGRLRHRPGQRREDIIEAALRTAIQLLSVGVVIWQSVATIDERQLSVGQAHD